ncbi:MAG: hypothetical protein KAW12_23895 [Candidatus Aminicenantes bacterium]|nr:hypothetical protein [Candidatus Aminicenantes bacterium]
MNNITKLKKIFIILLLVTVSGHIRAAIPVHDILATGKVIRHLSDILAKYLGEIKVYKDIIGIKDDYIRSMRGILYKSETLFWAITYFPKTVPGQYERNPFFFDFLNKDMWGDLYHKDGRIEDKYPEISDFSYITEGWLYRTKEKFREYADKVLALRKEDNKELQNEFDLLKMMREFQQERARLQDEFKDVIIPAFGSPENEAEEKKVVDVTRLYFAIARAKIEVLEQKLEQLMLEKNQMEKLLKKEVKKIRNVNLYIEYNEVKRNASD